MEIYNIFKTPTIMSDKVLEIYSFAIIELKIKNF